MAKKNDMSKWVIDEIQNAKFNKPVPLVQSGYVLDIYTEDKKVDVQLYDAVEDGRRIITMDIDKKIKAAGIEKDTSYEFKFNMQKAPLTKKAIEYLQEEKGIDMAAIYQFDLKSLKAIDKDSKEE